MILKKIYTKKALMVISTLFFSTVLSASITGTVYRDYNLNSQQDSAEPGIEGIILKAYNDNGIAVTTITNSSGFFNLNTNNGLYRVEVVNMPNYLQSSVSTGIASSLNERPTTFKENDGASGIKIGLQNPSEYTGDNPKILATTILAGKATTLHTLKLFDYDENSHINDTNNVSDITTLGESGTTWGLTYDKKRKKAYSSALLRRHAIIGNAGLGAIYSTDLSDLANPATSLLTTIPDTGFIDSTTRNIGSSFLSHDPVYAEVGNMGLGDLDISEDFNTLYTINLNTQELVEIDIDTQSQVIHTIQNPFGLNCPNSDVRSWGLAVHDNNVYIGSVCSTNITIGSAVSKWNGNTFTTIINTPLNYDREFIFKEAGDVANGSWTNWENDYSTLFNINTTIGSHNVIKNHVQPILADIEFTENGSLILGYIDRTSLQTGFDNHSPDINDNEIYSCIAGGDIRKVCNINNNYYNEGSTQCPQHNRNIDDMIPEFFIGDYHDTSNDFRAHNEITLGGLLYKKGSNRVATTAYDPMDQNNAISRSGVLFLDNTTGIHLGDQLLNGTDAEAGRETGFSKTAALGDIELLSDAAPIEIGNYVWSDINSNGIQDPSEIAISNVIVKLYKNNIEICSATTDQNGYYYFGGPLNTNLCGGDPLETNSNYALKINLNDPALNNQIPTLMNATADNADNDGDHGQIDTTTSTIQLTTGEIGENNHDLDFGFRPHFDLALIKTINTTATPGPYTPGDNITFTLTIFNQGKVNATNIQINDYIPTGLTLNDSNWISTGDIATLKMPISSLSAETNGVINITFKITEDFQGTSITNNAEIKSAQGGVDIDSIPNNETGLIPDPQDNDTANASGGDDYDLAIISVTQTFDLALIKKINTIATPAPYKPGDNITFTITVFNQGSLDATDIQINDYIPTGLTLNDSNWIQIGSTATLITPVSSLLHDTNITKDITFKITNGFQGTSIINNAEIKSAIGGTDIDSIPNSDTGTTPDPQDNDTTNTNGGDDYDPAVIPVTQTFDLALIKTINTTATPGPYKSGDSVTFTITIYNQGTLNATDIQINDYIPEGLILNDTQWNLSGTTATLKTLIPSLNQGTSITRDITFKISDNFYGTSIINNAEIKSAIGGTDIDSIPNNETGLIPDSQDNDTANTSGGDDYDLERIIIVTPIISGTLFNDGNGDNNVNGTPINKPDGTQLYVNLIDQNAEVVASKALANNGTYKFEFLDGVRANSCYTIVLSQVKAIIGNDAPSTTLPNTWNNTGENLNHSGNGNDGNTNGIIGVCVQTQDVPKVDLGINKAPTTENNSRPVEKNPNGNTCIITPNLSNQDHEDGSASTITILDLPSDGILYYNGILIQPHTTISNFDNSKLCADPYSGNVNIIFTYVVTDREGIQSNISTITMPFTASPLVTPTPTPTPKPIEPVEKISDLGETSVILHWSNQNNEYGYKIYQNGKLITIVDSDITSYTLNNLESAKSYTFVVYALDDNGETKIMQVTIKTKIIDWLVPIYHIILF